MTDEVYTDCPQCTEEIPFFHTVDEKKECPECGTPKDVLFDIAIGDLTEDTAVAATDGGVVADE